MYILTAFCSSGFPAIYFSSARRKLCQSFTNASYDFRSGVSSHFFTLTLARWKNQAVHDIQLHVFGQQFLERHLKSTCKTIDIQRVQYDRCPHAPAASRTSLTIAAICLYHIIAPVQFPIGNFVHIHLPFHLSFIPLPV